MAEATTNTGLHTTDAARRRLRKRYAFESRFQFFGILALILAALALVALLGTVVSKAIAAMTETYLLVDVGTDRAEIDPKGTNDPAVIKRADFESVVKKSLREAIPGVTGRRQKKELYQVVSDAAALELRQAAMEIPLYSARSGKNAFLRPMMSNFGSREIRELLRPFRVPVVRRRAQQLAM